MLIRPMTEDDIPAARTLAHQAMDQVRAATRSPGSPEPRTGDPSPEALSLWTRRAKHFLRHDPDGCWVADVDGKVAGVAMALRRDKLWGLSAYFVHPNHQGAGIGKALLDAVLGYSRGCLRGIIISTEDPRAARRYRLAGFSLHPTIRVAGVVDRTSLPVVPGVREGGPGDRDLCDSVDRQVRGAAHGVDHEFLGGEYGLLVCDTLVGSGYCYVDANGSPVLLAATGRKIAQRLLWSALARSPENAQVRIDYLTAAQEWAVDVALTAGLSLRTEGYLCLRHMRPPAPYIPSGAFL
ncbi:GNAT family N-acetyltransferase [Thermasporomyces composti]|uniref:GNAT family N-acetyltransferase n=1 Tax=Thermasporomyces composti TaxID=696763 RepID=UPI000E21DE75|nr:GNAT family N-acetyltransferase [Thermasporomyces composti]